MRLPSPKLVVGTAVLSLAVPAALSMLVQQRSRALAASMHEVVGAPVSIGTVDVGLTGTLRLVDLQLGDFFAAASVEGSLSLDSILQARFMPDEIFVEKPRLAIAIDEHGDSQLEALASRLQAKLAARRGAGSTGGGGPAPVRRIVVTGGAFTVAIAGAGEITATDVELQPQVGGVRVISGPVVAHLGRRFTGDLTFARGAIDLALPRMHVERALFAGGSGIFGDDAGTWPLDDVVVGRTTSGGPLELVGHVIDEGVARNLRATVQTRPTMALALDVEQLPLAPMTHLVAPSLDLDAAHVDGHLAVALNGAAGKTIDTQLTLTGAIAHQQSLAPMPFAADASASGRFVWAGGKLQIEHATLRTAKTEVGVHGWMQIDGAHPVAADLAVDLPSTPCEQVLAAIPAELRGPLDGLVLTGNLGGSLEVALDLAKPESEGVDLHHSIDLDRCTVVAEAPAADPRRVKSAVPHLFPDGHTATVGPGADGWVNVENVPNFVTGAFVSAEDGQFYHHHGFDLHQIGRSLEVDLRERKLLRGGSTISQQLVKNEWLTHRRTLDRKLQELFLTWRLEALVKKPDILARYLNIIELGPKVFGIGAAARYWFDKSAVDLSVKEVAMLAAMTSEPTSMTKRLVKNHDVDPDTQARIDTVLRAMRRDGVIDQAQYDEAKAAKLKLRAGAVEVAAR